MFKIIEEKGSMKGHDAVKIYKLEELGFVAVDFDRADGTNMEAWKCDESGYALNPDEKSMTFKRVDEPVSFDEAGEAEDWELVGFEIS